MNTAPRPSIGQFEPPQGRQGVLTPRSYTRQAVALCARFNPLAEKVWDEHWREFTYSGWRVGLHFAHRLKLTRRTTSDWISIGIADPHHLPPFCDHWKWNIHFSGPVVGVRYELLLELERRLERLAAHFNHLPASFTEFPGVRLQVPLQSRPKRQGMTATGIQFPDQ